MIKKILLIFIFISLLIGSFCFAQRELEIEYPAVPGVETPTTTKTILTEFIRYVFTFAIIIAGLLAFGALIYGGIRYLTSAGDPTKMSDGKNQAMAGFFGLIILLSSYLILNTINPQLVLPETPAIESLEQGIYAFVKTGCVDDPDDSFDDPIPISQSSPDLSIILPRDANEVPQSLQCIEFRSGKEELTVKVYSNIDYSPEPPVPYEGDPGEIKNVTGKSIELDYHPPGVYLYASANCDKTKEYKIYQAGSATLPEFDNKTQSIKFIYGFSDKGTIKISKEEAYSEAEAKAIAQIRCEGKGGEEVKFITETEKEYQYRCIIYDKRYAAILHEKENFMGEAMLYDQEPGDANCKNLSTNLYGGPTNISVSSITVYLKPVGEPIGDGVRFWGDKNYTKEKDDVEYPEGYYCCPTGWEVPDLEGYNDKITSMEMDGHYVALLFREKNYAGDCEVFMDSCPDFRSHRIGQCGWLGRSDCLSSFIIKARK